MLINTHAEHCAVDCPAWVQCMYDERAVMYRENFCRASSRTALGLRGRPSRGDRQTLPVQPLHSACCATSWSGISVTHGYPARLQAGVCSSTPRFASALLHVPTTSARLVPLPCISGKAASSRTLSQPCAAMPCQPRLQCYASLKYNSSQTAAEWLRIGCSGQTRSQLDRRVAARRHCCVAGRPAAVTVFGTLTGGRRIAPGRECTDAARAPCGPRWRCVPQAAARYGLLHPRLRLGSMLGSRSRSRLGFRHGQGHSQHCRAAPSIPLCAVPMVRRLLCNRVAV